MIRRPNVVWIVSDHQIHATRPPGFHGFPLQNKLATLGVTFDHAYTVLPVCSPARASMLTGIYPHAHGLTENDGRFGGREGLTPSDRMIHQAFLASGYRCAWFGKWHVDNHRSAMEYGFEGFSLPGYGYPYGTEAYGEYLERHGLEAPIARIDIPGESGIDPGTKIDLINQSDWFDCEAGVAALIGAKECHESYFLADQAERWMRSLDDEPFFLRVDTWGPHPPYLVPENYSAGVDLSDIPLPENFHLSLGDRPQHHQDYADYWSDTLNLDEGQWRYMYQQALAQGILVETALTSLLNHIDLDNTLVIFNSDHGDAVGSNGAMANKGGLMVEATMGIPLVMAGCGLPADNTRSQLVTSMDIAPTLLQALDIETDHILHGRSLVPLLEDPAASWRRGLMTQHYGLHVNIVQRAWYQDDWKLVLQPDGFAELYRLSDDPDEMNNLALDKEYAEQLSTMTDALFAAMDAHDDTCQILLPPGK